MNKITFPLKPRMQGPEVGDLQTVLQLLLDGGVILRDDEGARRELAAALNREHTEQTYGEVSRRLVRTFQEERSLQVSGTVEPTASALNCLLGSWSMAPELPEHPRAQRQAVPRATTWPSSGVVNVQGRDLRRLWRLLRWGGKVIDMGRDLYRGYRDYLDYLVTAARSRESATA